MDDIFTFVSGDLALDFAGTLRYRRAHPVEQLAEPDALGRWAVRAGLVDTPPDVDRAMLAEAVELREAIYRLAGAAQDGEGYSGADVALINAAAAGSPVALALDADGVAHRVGDGHAVLAELGRAAVALLGGPLAPTISECEASTCTRLYVDLSRGRTRRWCDMRACGNRAKAASFRARVSGDSGERAGSGASGAAAGSARS